MYPTVTVHVGSCIVTLHVTQKRHPARTVKRVRLTIEEVTFSRLPQDIIESLPLCVYDLRIDRAQVLLSELPLLELLYICWELVGVPECTRQLLYMSGVA